jgi:hypothetical protein
MYRDISWQSMAAGWHGNLSRHGKVAAFRVTKRASLDLAVMENSLHHAKAAVPLRVAERIR